MDDAQTLRSLVRDDAYRVVRVLADGPSGKTELVMLDGEGPLVRKRIPATLANASAWAAAMEVDEPLLPRIESLYRMPDELVVVYAYVDGESLDAVVRREGALSPTRAVAVVADVCRAVSALHERGVVHRDITPGNVILAADGAHLVDLGIARQRSEGRRHDTTTLGTWGFAAPEQYGFAQTDARSDVYALGRLLGYLLTAQVPGSDAYEEALDSLTALDAGLVRVVRTATAFEPSARYQRASDLAVAARAAVGGAATCAHVAKGATTGTSARPSSTSPLTLPRSATPAPPPAGPRRFSDAPVVLQAVCLLFWLVCAAAALLVASVDVDALRTGEPPYHAAQYGMSVVMIAGLVAVAYETFRALTYRRPYDAHGVHWGVLVTRISIIVAIIFVGMFLSALALPS